MKDVTWLVTEGVRCVSCPDCAFTFDAMHEDQDGTFSCPACELSEEPERLGVLHYVAIIMALALPTGALFGTGVSVATWLVLWNLVTMLPCGLRPCG